jgi:hypothetical protein
MYRTPGTQGNRLAPQKNENMSDEERKRKAREEAMMRRLSSAPGKTSSGMY